MNKATSKIEITEQMFRAIVLLTHEIYEVIETESFTEYLYYINYMTISKRDNFLAGTTYYLTDMNL